MKKFRAKGREGRRSASSGTLKMQPLVEALLKSAERRGDSFTELAKALGVSYERLLQWRRKTTEISKASDDVFKCASWYLGLPVVLTMALGGKIVLDDLIWPSSETLSERIGQEIELIRQDPHVGGLLPANIDSADEEVRLFVVFLYSQAKGASGPGGGLPWVNALQQAISGEAKSNSGIF